MNVRTSTALALTLAITSLTTSCSETLNQVAELGMQAASQYGGVSIPTEARSGLRLAIKVIELHEYKQRAAAESERIEADRKANAYISKVRSGAKPQPATKKILVETTTSKEKKSAGVKKTVAVYDVQSGKMDGNQVYEVYDDIPSKKGQVVKIGNQEAEYVF